jgi:hypothetical protein
LLMVLKRRFSLLSLFLCPTKTSPSYLLKKMMSVFALEFVQLCEQTLAYL